MEIRKASKNDINIAWQIRKESIVAECSAFYSAEIMELWLHGALPDDFSKELENNFYIAVVNKEIVGLGALSFKEHKIYAIFVKPEFLKKGIGKKMLIFLEGLAFENGMDTIYLDSTLNAAEFYWSLGYVGNKIIKYNNPRGFVMDCIAMSKSVKAG